MILAVARAGFRERRRRPAYAVVLIAAVGLGYLAIPAPDSHWTIVSLGGYRGVYNSAYTGTVAALAGALWLCVGGFFVVRTALAQDRATGVRELLVASRIRSASYLVGTFLGNFLVLASMAGALALTAVIMQLARGESAALSPVALLAPFVLFTLPVLAVTAALAVLWETVPGLRGGFGNVVWFGVALVGMIAAQSPTAPLGGLGTGLLTDSLRTAMTAQGLRPEEGAIGFMYLDTPPTTFVWTGLPVTAEFVGQRALLVLAAVVVAVVPALWFARLSPLRSSGGPPRTVPAHPYNADHAAPVAYARGAEAAPSTLARLVVGEARVLLSGVSRWWWAVAAVLFVAAIFVPSRALLLASWGWPVLVWSRLGLQGRDVGVDALLAAAPRPVARLLAEWVAGVAFTAAVGGAAIVRSAPEAWSGALFVPSLALLLGLVSGVPRLFQALYLTLWWCVVNEFAFLDYLSAVPGGPSPLAVTAVSAALLALAVAVTTARVRLR
ncbi:hypothetical protein [Cryptosporangium arvum]|uniref:hypothetical protein n=1 Tax=Cryptosporangium arvum TaxID=80871 RepID=UPI0004B08EED|nr:hypothetical protein [Cryptosporangium arvum]